MRIPSRIRAEIEDWSLASKPIGPIDVSWYLEAINLHLDALVGRASIGARRRESAGIAALCFDAHVSIAVVDRFIPGWLDNRTLDESTLQQWAWSAFEKEVEYAETTRLGRAEPFPCLCPRPPHAYIALMRVYLRKAYDAFADGPGQWPALDVLRKIGALACRCVRDLDAAHEAE